MSPVISAAMCCWNVSSLASWVGDSLLMVSSWQELLNAISDRWMAPYGEVTGVLYTEVPKDAPDITLLYRPADHYGIEYGSRDKAGDPPPKAEKTKAEEVIFPHLRGSPTSESRSKFLHRPGWCNLHPRSKRVCARRHLGFLRRL